MDTLKFDDRLFVATLTPYKGESFEIDEAGYREHLRHFIKASGPREKLGIIALPEAGEVFYLSSEEKRRLVEIAVEEVNGAIPVIAGVSESTTSELKKSAADYASMGVDGFFVLPATGAIDITSSWNVSAYPEVFIDMVKEIVDAAPEMPLVAHPLGGTLTPDYGIGFPADMSLKTCMEIPNFVGWKMTYHYPGFRKMVRALRSLEHKVRLYPSSAPYYHEYLASDYLEGTATGAFNYGLQPMLKHIAAWRDGDIELAKDIWLNQGLAELQEYVYSTYSRLHVKYKVAAWLGGYVGSPVMRPPMPAPRRDEVDKLVELLSATGTELRDSNEIEDFKSKLKY